MEIWVPTMIYHIEKKMLVCQQKVTWKWFLFRKYFQTEWLHCKVNERIAWIKDSNNSNFHRYASNASSWCVWLMMILHSSIIWWYFYFNLQMLGKCEKNVDTHKCLIDWCLHKVQWQVFHTYIRTRTNKWRMCSWDTDDSLVCIQGNKGE